MSLWMRRDDLPHLKKRRGCGRDWHTYMTSKADGEKIVLTWLERGGPPVTPPDGDEGYGSKLVQRSVRAQLGGTIDYEWSAEGLIATICMERSRLSS
jgi:two-component sensor histidine kinase